MACVGLARWRVAPGGGGVGSLGWVCVWMALAACLDRCCVAGRGGRVKHCTATPFGRLLEKPRLSLS